MHSTISPVKLIETHFGNLREPRAAHSKESMNSDPGSIAVRVNLRFWL